MKKVYTIGRDQQNDIVIDDSTDVVSRLHATIRFNGNKMFLIDQSQNGTYVNGMKMSVNEEVPVTRKDKVVFANVAELDWRMVPNAGPDAKKIAAYVALAVLVLAIMAAFIWAVSKFSGDGENVTKDPQIERNDSNPNGIGTSGEGIEEGNNEGTDEDTKDEDTKDEDEDNTDEKPVNKPIPKSTPETKTEPVPEPVPEPTNDIPLY